MSDKIKGAKFSVGQGHVPDPAHESRYSMSYLDLGAAVQQSGKEA